MIVSLFVNRSYRDFGDRPFKSYFTTNRPTFIMTEWILDNKADRFLAGMMVRKSQREDNDAEELEMYTFTGNYSKACSYDIENLPVIRQEGRDFLNAKTCWRRSVKVSRETFGCMT